MKAILNSSISNSERNWANFWKVFILSLFSCASLLYIIFYVIDPYGIYPFSLNFERRPVKGSQVFVYSTLARNPDFDSVIIGTSTSKLLKPEKLNRVFNASFANMALYNGTAFYQTQLLNGFLHHHPKCKVILIGLDIVWWESEENYDKYRNIDPEKFPFWLWDNNPWNDILPFSLDTFRIARRQIEVITGLRDPEYSKDGYTSFLPAIDEYDIDKVRKNIYKSVEPIVPISVAEPVNLSISKKTRLKFPALSVLDACLKSVPEDTIKILMFVPYHYYKQPRSGTYEGVVFEEARRRIVDIGSAYKNVHIIDFMLKSEITSNDYNYWDSIHYTEKVADQLVDLIAQAYIHKQSDPKYYIYRTAENTPTARIASYHTANF